MADFSQQNSIPILALYVLTARIRVFNSFSFFANSLMSSVYIKWLIFSYDLWSWYPPVHYPKCVIFSSIAISNSNGDIASPWKILLWIWTSVKLFLLLSVRLSSFSCFFYKLYDFTGYLVHFVIVYHPALQDHIICGVVVNSRHNNVLLLWLLLRMC